VSYMFLSMGPYAAVDYNNLTLCPLQNRLYNTFTMGIPMPLSTLTLFQSRLYLPVRTLDFASARLYCTVLNRKSSFQNE
jgi:hypothetical protein